MQSENVLPVSQTSEMHGRRQLVAEPHGT